MTQTEKDAVLAALRSTIEPTRRAAMALAAAAPDKPPFRSDIDEAAALVNTRPIMAAIAAVERIEVTG